MDPYSNSTAVWNNSLADNSKRLNEQHIILEVELRRFIPVISVLGLICLAGVIGNIHALIVFRRYPVSPVTILVSWMVLMDLVSSSTCIPLELFLFLNYYSYPSRILCKITRFLTHYTTLSAGTYLIIVSVERRQKTCAPFQRQMTMKQAKILSMIVFLFTAIISIPAPIFYDVTDNNTTVNGVMGKGCSYPVVDSIVEGGVYGAVLAIICLVGFLICSIAYAQIVMVIRRQIRSEKNRKTVYTKTQYPLNMQTQIEDRNTEKSITQNNSTQLVSTLQRRKGREKLYKDSRLMTIMFLVATSISFIGFVLHVIGSVVKVTLSADMLRNIEPINLLLLRGYFLHCAIHPIIYFVIDQRFRTECRKLYSKCFSLPFQSASRSG